MILTLLAHCIAKNGQGVVEVDLMNGVAAENAGAQVTDDSHGFTEFHHHHLLRDSLSVNTRFKMMISTVDSGFDSGSSPALHMSSLEDPPMSRTHQYRKVNIDNTLRILEKFLVYVRNNFSKRKLVK